MHNTTQMSMQSFVTNDPDSFRGWCIQLMRSAVVELCEQCCETVTPHFTNQPCLQFKTADHSFPAVSDNNDETSLFRVMLEITQIWCTDISLYQHFLKTADLMDNRGWNDVHCRKRNLSHSNTAFIVGSHTSVQSLQSPTQCALRPMEVCTFVQPKCACTVRVNVSRLISLEWNLSQFQIRHLAAFLFFFTFETPTLSHRLRGPDFCSRLYDWFRSSSQWFFGIYSGHSHWSWSRCQVLPRNWRLVPSQPSIQLSGPHTKHRTNQKKKN